MTFHYWYYLDLLLDRRFIHILITFSISHYLIFRPNFDEFRRNFDRCPFDELSFDENSTNGRVRRDVGFDGRSHSTKGLSTKCHGRDKGPLDNIPLDKSPLLNLAGWTKAHFFEKKGLSLFIILLTLIRLFLQDCFH